ncbi:MAG: YkgJ family cysteine cluster protein [Candidatus Gastranaerophilales bacterium]|nr:YkgJ family cysteine cluster protein [Candidatus Gastranaerophilales bacterium]
MSIDLIKSLYYEVLSYFVPEKTKYRIEGVCNKCGNCCREIRCIGLKNQKELKIMQFFFPLYRNFYITGSDEKGNLILCCKNLDENSLCTIYKKRPLFCRRYPLKTLNFYPELINGCSYKVIKKDFKDYL